MAELVVISRTTGGDTVHGRTLPDRVWVTGPHFGPGSTPMFPESGFYSSTEDRAEATRFSRDAADYLLAMGKWTGREPRIEPA